MPLDIRHDERNLLAKLDDPNHHPQVLRVSYNDVDGCTWDQSIRLIRVKDPAGRHPANRLFLEVGRFSYSAFSLAVVQCRSQTQVVVQDR